MIYKPTEIGKLEKSSKNYIKFRKIIFPAITHRYKTKLINIAKYL